MMQPAVQLQPGRGAFISEGLSWGRRRLLTDRETPTAARAATSFLLLGRQPSSLTLDGAGDWEAASRWALLGGGWCWVRGSLVTLLINTSFHL